MSDIVQRKAFTDLERESYDLSSIFEDKEVVCNLDLVCALNLLAIHRVVSILKRLDTAEIYGDERMYASLESIVAELKTSKYLSLSEFKDFSDRRNIERLLTDINAAENNTSLSRLCNGDIVVYFHQGHQVESSDSRPTCGIL
jgi:hypothetical protein